MKRFSKVFSIVLMLAMCMTVPAFAAESSYDVSVSGDGSVTAVFDDATGTLTISGNGAMKDYGSSNQPYASHKSSVKSIVVENGVTEIGTYAFYGYTGATSISIAGSVATIDDYAFYNCNAVSELVIPEGVEFIGERAFMSNKFKTLTIPSTVETIESKAFANGLRPLENLTINATGYDFKSDIFGDLVGKDATSKNATIQASNVWTIDLFESLGYSVSTIGSAGDEWSSYPSDEIYELGDNVKGYYNASTGVLTVRGNGAISDFSGISLTPIYNCDAKSTAYELVIEEGITRIGNHAFNNTAVTSISLPQSLESIGDYAFSTSKGVSSLVIPKNVETIGQRAFYSLTNMESLTFESGSALKTISNEAFLECNSLDAVSIPEGTTYIGKSAFENGWELDNIYIPASVTEIGAEAFRMYGRDEYAEDITLTNEGDENQIVGTEAFYTTTKQKLTVNMNPSNTEFSDSLTEVADSTVPTINDLGSGGSGESGNEGAGGGSGSGTEGSGGGSGGSATGSEEPPVDKDTMIILDAVPTNFMVTVPIVVELNQKANGTVDTGDGYVVANECAWGPILIKDIKVVPATNWSIAAWDSDFRNMQASTKKLGMTINGAEVSTSGAVTLNDSLSSVIKYQSEKELTFEAKLPAQRMSLRENIAAVVFTVDFDKV